MDGVLDDIRYALRSYPSRSASRANTAIFALVNGVLPPDVPGVTRPERLTSFARSIPRFRCPSSDARRWHG